MTSNAGKKTSLGQTKPNVNKDRAEELEQRPRRNRSGGRSDIISVEGMDPNFSYRLVKDVMVESEEKDKALVARPGQRIMKFLDDGWTFVQGNEVVIGGNYEYKTGNLGSLIKIPAGQDEYLYLLKIKKEWFEQDHADLAKRRLDIDVMQTEDAHARGLYGSVTFE